MKCRLELFIEAKGCGATVKEAIDDEKRHPFPGPTPGMPGNPDLSESKVGWHLLSH